MLELKQHPEKIKFDKELRAKYSRKTESMTEKMIRLADGRKILIWGACNRADFLCAYLRNALEERGQIHLWAGFIDSNPEILEYRGEVCSRPDKIDPEQYFIIFALLNHYDDIHALLSERGYQEEKDYFYWSDLRPGAVTVTNIKGYYCDNFGNEIIGSVKGGGARSSLRGVIIWS